MTKQWISSEKCLLDAPFESHGALETYVKAVKQDVDKAIHQVPKKHHCDNLTPEERKALSSLRKRTDIITKKVDKGSTMVVMSHEGYVNEVRRPL